MANASKRLAKEIRDLDPPEGCSAAPTESDIYAWNCMVVGPRDTPYAGGKFELTLKFPPEFPLRPPKASFKTRVYHPNVKDDGEICIDILKDAWSATLTVGKILLCIQVLLSDGNAASPLMPDIAEVYAKDRPAFNRTAREWAIKYASAPADADAGAAAAAPAAAAPAPAAAAGGGASSS